MNKLNSFILFCFLLMSSASAWAQKQLVILHTNDTHSCVMPLSKDLADTLFAGRGGFVRRVAMIKEQRAQNPNLLLFDSGDFSQGSPYYTLYKGDVEIGLMNEMGYDAATIGNHEFDFGMDNMVRIFKKAKFPILCSNYDFSGTKLKDIVKPWTIIKRNGIKIGLFALCPKLAGLVSTKNYGPIKYLNPVEVGEKMANFLKKEKKCDLVICISHLGFNIGGDDDVKLVECTRNIDLVLGGHSHTYLKQLEYRKNLDGKEVGIDQNGKHGIFVGKLVLDLTRSKK